MLYVILSAILYIIGTLNPTSSLITMTTFLIPLCLFNLSKQWHIRFGQGFVWGIIVFGIHWWWLLMLLYTKAVGGWWSYLLWILLVIWCCCLSGIWFCLFTHSRLWSSVAFFVIISKYWMFACGVVEGYPLCSPLVCLAHFPWTLDCLYWLSDSGVLTMLLAMQIALVNLCRDKSLWGSTCILVSCIGIVALGHWCAPYKRSIPSNIVTICPWWYGCGDPIFAGYRMSHDICKAVQNSKDASIIIMPESTFCWDLKEYESFVSIWCDSAGDIPILLGAHQAEDGFPHNAILLLHNNHILFSYRKQHFMPLVERSIWIERLLGKSLMFSKLLYSPITKDMDLLLIDEVTIQIFICSEFFFEAKPVNGYPILLLWNDSWLQLDYAKELARLYIQYFEKKYRVPVLHMSTQGVTNIGIFK